MYASLIDFNYKKKRADLGEGIFVVKIFFRKKKEIKFLSIGAFANGVENVIL